MMSIRSRNYIRPYVSVIYGKEILGPDKIIVLSIQAMV